MREETLIEDVEFSVRTTNCLNALNIKTMKDLSSFSEEDLRKCRNIGKKSLCEIRERLKEMDLKLKNDPEPFVPEKGRWYEMKEIAPPEEGMYLIIHTAGIRRKRMRITRWGQRSYNKWNWWPSGFTASSVTHWRLLPEFPEIN